MTTTSNIVSLQPALDKKREAERIEAAEDAEFEAETKAFHQQLFEMMGLNMVMDLSDKPETQD